MENKLTRVSDVAILELKKRIVQSKDVPTDEAKKILVWFIDQSNNASESIAMSIVNEDFASQVQSGVLELHSDQGKTFLDAFMKVNGFLARFHQQPGTFDDKGKFNGSSSGITIWISTTACDKHAKIIKLNLWTALKINLKQFQ